ncbi:MAG: STAS domain-containing protein [Solirubrobacteraceae bacterium]
MAPASMDGFSLESVDLGAQACMVVVRGGVGVREARALQATALECVLRGRRAVVVDLRGVTHLGAGLLGSILRMRRGLSAVEGHLALVVDGPPVRELVEASVLRALVHVSSTPAQALAHVTAPASPR